MKKILYSLIAVAMCACAQSDVEEEATPTPTPPQPENNSLIFTVIDNGFADENGTRVTYGQYGSENNGAYKAYFDENDAIGVYAIKSSLIDETGIPKDTETECAYTVRNAKFTFKNGAWTGILGDIGEADMLFAYTPYSDTDYTTLDDGEPLFTYDSATQEWKVSTGDNRFFVGHGLNDNKDNSDKDKFEAADMMGAATKITPTDKTVTFQMQHMRSMIELTIPKGVELTNMTLEVNTAKYKFTPYKFAETTEKNVYRILTTEYQSQNTLYATIRDGGIVKNYKKVFTEEKVGAGKCIRMKISKYTPTTHFEAGKGETLANFLTNNPDLTALRLSGTLTTADLNTLKNLANAADSKLTMLDMYDATLPDNTLPNSFLYGNNTLTTLYLPDNLEIINYNALQVQKVTNIDIPASVKTIGQGAFYHSSDLSVRIPEGSLLESVGPGAFDGIQAVYTYNNNMTMVVLPKSLNTINDTAFYGVKSLNKIVFTSANAPTIGSNAFAGTNATIYVPNSTNYKNQKLFPSKKVYAGLVNLTAADYASDYTTTDAGVGLSGLCDFDNSTFWHSTWKGNPAGHATYGHYIDITLPKAMTSLAIEYVTRGDNNNAVPSAVNIYYENGNTWKSLGALPKNGETLPTGLNATYTSAKMTAASISKIRFAVIESSVWGSSTMDLRTANTTNSYSVALAELLIAEDIWTEPAAASN